MRKILPTLILLLLPVVLNAQSVVMNSFTNTLVCLGSNTFKLPYTVTGSFGAGNVFTVQLSNASGSFATPVNIGTDTSTNSDTILFTIPITTPLGSGYRIRIVASNPSVTSADNGANIQISPSPEFTLDSTFVVCSTRDIELTVKSLDTTLSYSWSGPNSYTSTAKSAVIDSSTIWSQGIYTVAVSKGGCTTTRSTWLNVKNTPFPPIVTSNTPLCLGDTLNMQVSGFLSSMLALVITPSGQTFRTYSYYSSIPTFADTGIYMAFYISPSDACMSDTVYHRVAMNNSFVPTVIIWPIPRKSVGPYTPVTFYSRVYNNYKPKYQWYLNGTAIAGATDTMFTVQNFATGDKVHLLVSSDTTCTKTASSDTVTLEVNLGVSDGHTWSKLIMFPNPNNGRFSVDLNDSMSGPALIEIFNTVGQCILNQRIEIDNGILKQVNIALAPTGIYRIRISTEKEQFTSTFRKE